MNSTKQKKKLQHAEVVNSHGMKYIP